ncbi:MAG: hypothetical protein RLZZ153_912 [Pseudomonadota bacterium]|jgi:DNA-binding NarL/FixJ family response regulator
MQTIQSNEAQTVRRFLLVDDHPIVCEAIRLALETIASDIRVDFAPAYAEARRALQANPDYDCVLLDLGLPDIDGMDALERLREQNPRTRIVMLSASSTREIILRCLELGAAGFIPKTSHPDVLRSALRMVAAGHVYVPREAITADGYNAMEGARPLHSTTSTDPRKLGLTGRQCDVLRLILRGFPNKLICRELKLAEGTVKIHVSAVLRVLGVRNRTQAVIAANRLGLRVAAE